ncbi:MAG: lysophospholipid acyltransferase family protein [Solirubrobacteraceae bacterium]
MAEPSDAALDRAHARARAGGVSPGLYGFVRLLLSPFLHGWFRLHISGRDHIPAEGPAILAPNHKSFIDAFFVALGTRRRVRYMAKARLFGGLHGRLLVRLGAFPVRRGEADADALETARAILLDGGLVVVFPEGTRVDMPDALGSPHHGAGRLALETGAPIVPTALAGTAHLWLGPLPKPRIVRLAFAAPVRPTDAPATRQALEKLIDGEVWPAVQDEYGRMAATPGPVLSALAALGLAGGLLARRRARRTPRLLGVVPPGSVRRAQERLRRRA